MARIDERSRNMDDADSMLARGLLETGAPAGEYILTGVLAHGGGGVVYAAHHAATGRAAAVKVLHQALTALPKMVERFRREVRVLNLLRHPGIVEVWEVGALPDGRPFFAMERLTGRTLSAVLEAEGRMLPDEALEIFEPVCAALAAAHSAGVIHRDVKPTNIMVLDGSPRRIKLLDFGVAKLQGPTFSTSHNTLTSEGTMVGSPTSMAPEQILGREVDARTDIYALGVLLHRMLTGRPPFAAVSPLAQIRQHLEMPAPRPSLRAPAAAPLDPIVLRAMEKDPSLRYRSIGDLQSALRSAVSGAALREERSHGAAGVGVAIYVEIRLDDLEGETAERFADHLGVVLDTAEDTLREAGLLQGFLTGNEVLAVRPLPIDRAAAQDALVDVVRVALLLRERLDALQRAARGVHANICLHAGEVLLRATSARPAGRGAPPRGARAPALEVLGGPLVRADVWAPREPILRVAATPAVMSRLPDGALPPGAGQLVPLPAIDLERTLPPPSLSRSPSRG